MGCAARRILAPVIATLLVGLGAPPAPDNPAGAIAAAAGHPARRHLRAEATDARGDVRWTLDVDATRRLTRTCQTDLCQGTWFDGASSVVYGINGTPFPDRERDDRVERTFCAIASTAFAEAEFFAAGGRVTAQPGGGARIRYLVRAPDGAELIAVADAQNNHLAAVERPDGSVYAELIGSGTASSMVYDVRPYDRVTSVNDPLRGPDGPHVRVAQTREVELLPGPLPIVPCRLAGHAATCLIDSGTTPSAMTLAFAEQLDREPRGTIEIAGLRPYTTGAIDAGPLDLAGAHADRLTFAVVPRARGADFDIILGSDVLAGLQVEVDPRRHHARIGATGSTPGGSAIAVDFGAGLPFTDVRLADRQTSESMLIDTGDTATVSIGYDAYRTDMSLFAAHGRSVAVGATAVAMDTIDGELPHIDVGPVHLDDVAIAAVRGQHQGHLGYGFAARCAPFVLDLGQRRIECRHVPRQGDAPPARHGER